jgi:hypothetical protein
MGWVSLLVQCVRGLKRQILLMCVGGLIVLKEVFGGMFKN